jgi:hypothetical protein
VILPLTKEVKHFASAAHTHRSSANQLIEPQASFTQIEEAQQSGENE